MSSGLKKILSFLFIALSITVVFFIAFSNEDLTNAFDAIKQMNLTWLACIFACWLIYTVCTATLPPAPQADSRCRSIPCAKRAFRSDTVRWQ